MAAIPDARKSKRASKPKTRAGCKTCKKRRVKCDEGKPTCNRCLKYGVTCDGYVKPEELTSLLPIKIILPRGSNYFQPIFYEVSADGPLKHPYKYIANLKQPRITAFRNQQEVQYFHFFRSDIAPHLAGSFHSDLWSHLVLQACERDDAIRHAIVAIAALKISAQASHSRSIQFKSHVESDTVSSHQEFALQQYQKAIKCMRKASVGGVQDLRTMLLTCIVIICFESFAGNFGAAVKQAVVGVNLVDGLLSNPSQSSQSSIEKEILNTFGRIDSHAMAFLDPRYPKRLPALVDRCHYVNTMPSKFATLSEARDALMATMQKIMHFTSSLSPETFNYSGFLRLDFMMNVPVEDFEVKSMHLAELEAWRAAIDKHIEDSLIVDGTTTQQNNRFCAASLELMYLAGYVTICMMRTYGSERPDTRELMPQFEKMVALSEELLTHPHMTRPNSTYMFEMHTICPLYAVTWYCPSRTVREKAIELLVTKPRREALWDSVMVGKLAEWIMELEDANYEGEFAPDHVRCTRGDVIGYNMITREAEVRCYIPDPETSELVDRTTILSF